MVADPGCRSGACPKTLDAGLAQLKAGLAWWYREYAHEQLPEDARQYELAEWQARSRREGLWEQTQPMPPWEWRRAMR
jgi:endonuclease YncB( thermonuclease family)